MATALMCVTSCKKAPEDPAKYQFTETIRSTDPRTPEEERAGFRLPDGFEIEVFASEPQIGKPINMTFDAQGRLWVTQSASYPIPGSGSGDKITILEDTDDDGKADRFVDFCDTLNVPIGILPTNAGAVAFSIPNIYQFNDANADGRADDASAIIGTFGYVDTHGMVSNFIVGYDGWVHGCHGFTNKSVVAGSDGDSITLISGNTFRFRIDGSRIEQTTFGQVNPFGLVYDELGYLYSTDSHSSPLYQLIQGGNYPHFGKEELMGFGPDMKSLENEATALCGITQYADTRFPEEFRGNFFIGDALKSIVHRYSWEFKGSSPVGRSEEDFILSADPWFRPVNIKLGPDGALYVADFYNAIIGHYEVPLGHPKRDKTRGRIWRITYNGDHHKKQDLSVATLHELLTALDHDNLPTRMEATNQIVDRIGAAAAAPLTALLDNQRTSARKNIHALWALQRLGRLSDNILERSIVSQSPLVRLHTMRIVNETGLTSVLANSITRTSLKDPDVHVRRAAVETLMKFPGVESVKAALETAEGVPAEDTHLMYTIRLTVRNLLRQEGVLQAVLEEQWPGNQERLIAEILLEVDSPLSAVFLSQFLSRQSLSDKKTPIAYRQMASLLPDQLLEKSLREAMDRNIDSITLATAIFKNIRRGLEQRATRVQPGVLRPYAIRIGNGIFDLFPPGDTATSKEVLANQSFAAELAGDFDIESLEAEMRVLFNRKASGKAATQLRTAAFRSLIKLSSDNIDLAANILQDEHESLEFRREVAAVLGEFPGVRTIGILQKVDNAPTELQPVLVSSMAATSDGKDIIFRQVRQGKIRARVLLEPQIEERILLNISPAQQREYSELVANLQPVSEEKEKLVRDRIEAFKSVRQTSGLLDSGRIIFNRYCAACHRRANQIGIGPQLHGIGKRGPEAIIEKIMDPNRNISPAFQNYTIRLKNGKVVVGLYRREEGEALVLADMAGKEFTIARRDIETKEASRYTLMPDNFSESIDPKDFNALVTYLLSW